MSAKYEIGRALVESQRVGAKLDEIRSNYERLRELDRRALEADRKFREWTAFNIGIYLTLFIWGVSSLVARWIW